MAKPLNEKLAACHHTEEECVLHGTWCTPEIMKSLEMGYDLWSVDEVWHFPERPTALFRDYINTWLKIKEEASWTGKPEEKAAFIKAYYANEGILFEADKMEYNLGLRSVVKISFNNMWGEVGISPEQDPNQRFHRTPQADGVFGLGRNRCRIDQCGDGRCGGSLLQENRRR